MNLLTGYIKAIPKALEWLLPIKGDQELSKPAKLTLRWESEKSRTDTVELSDDPDFAEVLRYETTDHTLKIGNLKIGTTYYWRVNGCPKNGLLFCVNMVHWKYQPKEDVL